MDPCLQENLNVLAAKKLHNSCSVVMLN